MIGLTEAERDALTPWDREGVYTCPSERERCDDRCRPEHEYLSDVVERIIADRLAAIVAPTPERWDAALDTPEGQAMLAEERAIVAASEARYGDGLVNP